MRSAVLSPRAVVVLLFIGGAAVAAQYETDIDIDNETELYELQQRGDISEGTLNTLVELLRTGVDLNTASRDELYELPNITYAEVDQILEYRKRVTFIDDPADLVAAGILSEKQLLQIAPFVVISPPSGVSVPITGWLRLVGMYTVGDPYVPAGYTQARLKGPYGLSAGLLAVDTRRRLGEVQWDAARAAFTAPAPRVGVELPKFFVQWKGAQRSVLAGTYNIGFAQRLTLDTTTRQTPDGIYADDQIFSTLRLSSFCRLSGATGTDPDCTEEEDSLYVTPDFRWRIPLRGVAGTIQDLSLGETANVGFTGFASYQTKNAYQYSLYNRETCADPHDDDDPGCAAPTTFLRRDDGTIGSTRISYQTLPALFDEYTAGGNAHLKLGPGRRIGLTGYYSNPVMRIPQVDFQEWNRMPYGGPFGAVGLDGAYAMEMLSFFIESSRSFDSTPGNGGGFAIVQRSVFSYSKQEVELLLRYYDPKYANPYSGAFAEPDQLDGQIVRNELGARLRYLGKALPDLPLRAFVDFWTLPADGNVPGTAGKANLRASVRGDFTGWSFIKPGLWLDYRNKGLAPDPNGDDPTAPDQQVICIETTSDDVSESLPCDGEAFRVAERLQLVPHRQYLTLLLQAVQRWAADERYDNGFRTDLQFLVQASSRPLESLRLRVRTRWSDQGVDNPLIGESQLWSLADIAWVMPRRAEIRLRYDNVVWLDERDSTVGTPTQLPRSPNPEHRLRLELEGRF